MKSLWLEGGNFNVFPKPYVACQILKNWSCRPADFRGQGPLEGRGDGS